MPAHSNCSTLLARKKYGLTHPGQQFTVHLLGTCRMGDDSKTSFVNSDHRTHDVKNLFLCDGSSPRHFRPRPAHADDSGARLSRSDRITALAKRGDLTA